MSVNPKKAARQGTAKTTSYRARTNVKAKYPDAYPESFGVRERVGILGTRRRYCVIINDGDGNAISDECESIDAAWKNADERLE